MSDDIISLQAIASGFCPGTQTTPLTGKNQQGCALAYVSPGVYTATLDPGIVGPAGIVSAVARTMVTPRTANRTIVVTYGADDSPAVPGLIHLKSFNQTSGAAAECDLEFTVRKVLADQ